MMDQMPPECCVPAFLVEAIRHYGSDAAICEIARALGTSVGPRDDNPCGLRVEQMRERRGVRLDVVEKKGPAIVERYGLSLAVIPSGVIPRGTLFVGISDGLHAGVAVGVAFGYAADAPEVHPGEATPHVARAVEVRGERVCIRDLGWYNSDDLEAAMHRVAGGLLLVGPQERVGYATVWTPGHVTIF